MPDFIFDVDGTLTPSRARMDKHFAVWFSKFCENNNVYLVSGSDRPKTIEQVGEYIYHKCKRVYQCAGNDVYEQDTNIYKANIDWHPHTIGFFSDALKESKYPVRTGIHSELRTGLINFSIVGRKASMEQRAEYKKYDKLHQERAAITAKFNKQFPQYHASVAGEIGIDIVPRGLHKGQIVTDFDFSENVTFFGDKCDQGGNDYELALAVDERGGKVYNVSDWKETREYLKEL
jgi:phosphomannomutase